MDSPEQLYKRAASALIKGAPPALAILTSVPVLTLLLLVFIDLWLRQGNPVDALGFRSVDMWDLPPRIELCKATRPDLVLLGSSLIMALDQDQHGHHYYKGAHPWILLKDLNKVTRRGVSCIDLGSGLQVVSEAYLLADAVCSQGYHPRVIVYGLALRDFFDNNYAAEWCGDSFNSIAPYVPISPRVLQTLTSSRAALELIFDHYWYLYRNRLDFKNLLSALSKDFLENLPLDKSYDRFSSDYSFHASRTGFLWEAWVPRRQEDFTEAFYRNNPLQARSYFLIFQSAVLRTGVASTMAIEMHYLACLIELCKEKNIKLVLVNMPVSPEVTRYAPRHLYDTFRSFLRTASGVGNVALVDFFDQSNFSDADFKDGVHLTFSGAGKFSAELVSRLGKQYPDVIELLSKP